jgi:antitoxin component YwqK of YwqJK toxin-antitoxin module
MKGMLLAAGLLLMLLPATIFGQAPAKNQRDDAGKRQGYWEAVDRNGKLVYSGYFKDDKPAGEMKRYHPSGGVRAVMVYDVGGENARTKFFWQNGALAAEGNYIGTRRDSVWTYYSYYNKKVSYKATYTGGMRNGVSQSFYPDEVLAEEISWSNDKKDGPWKQYFDNGKLKLTGEYKNDLLNGAYIIYYSDGKKETEGFYRNDIPDGKWIRYNNNGTVASTIEYADGQITNPDELEAAEQEFFRNLEEQKGRIKEPTVEDLMREAQNNP